MCNAFVQYTEYQGVRLSTVLSTSIEVILAAVGCPSTGLKAVQDVFYLTRMVKALTFENKDVIPLCFMYWNDEDLFEAAFNDERIRDEALRDIERERDRIAAMPIMLKALQIGRLVSYICETLPPEDLAQHYREIMQNDARIISGKVSSAEGCSVFSVKMENAVLIKMAAKNLLSQMSGLRLLGYSDPRYIRLLCDEIEEFRNLFVDWIATFDRRCNLRDGWGIFN